MRQAENGIHEAKGLRQLGPETGEHEVGQQNLLLHFSGDIIGGSRVGQAKGGPSV
jgi:hypothetical protein